MHVTQLRRWVPWLQSAGKMWRDRKAVTSVEYVIIAIIITVAIVGGLSSIGGYLANDFNQVSSEL